MSDLQDMQMSIDAAKKSAAIAQAIARLRSNKDFKLAILDTFMRDTVLELVMELANPHLPEKRANDNQASIEAAGKLNMFLNTAEAIGNDCIREMASNDAVLAHLARNEV